MDYIQVSSGVEGKKEREYVLLRRKERTEETKQGRQLFKVMARG